MASPTDRDYDLMTVIRRSVDTADKMNNTGLSVTVSASGFVAAISMLHVRHNFSGVY